MKLTLTRFLLILSLATFYGCSTRDEPEPTNIVNEEDDDDEDDDDDDDTDPGTIIKKDVYAYSIPGFSIGQSGLPRNYFSGTYESVYFGFVNRDNTSHVVKLNGTTFTTHASDKVYSSIFPYRFVTEGDNEISFYWSGVSENDDSTYGLYNKNNSTPEFKYQAENYMSFIMVENTPAKHIWGISTGFTTTNVFSETHSHTFEQVAELPASETTEGALICYTPSEDDAYIWIGLGKTLYKVTANKQYFYFDFSSSAAPGAAITKVVHRNGIVWALLGSKLIKIVDDKATLFYTLGNAGRPSFDVDNNYVYTNDGFKISISFGTKEALFGDAPATAANKAEYDRAKMQLSACDIVTTHNATDRYIYMLSVIDAKIYKIQK